MNEKEIQSFSLETLLTVNEPRPEDLYFDGCLIASRVKIMDTVNIDLFRYPTRLDAFAILFCSEGSISFTSGLRRHTLDAKMLFVLLPGSILQVESIRPESSVYTVICEEEFIRRINIDIKLLSRLFLSVEKPALPAALRSRMGRHHRLVRRNPLREPAPPGRRLFAGDPALDDPHAGLQGLPHHRGGTSSRSPPRRPRPAAATTSISTSL